MRSISLEESAAYVAEHRRHCEAERHELAQRFLEAQAQPNEVRERVRALRAQQQPADDDVPALAQMLQSDPDNALARAGRHMDEMLAAGKTTEIHSLTERRQ